MKNTSIEVIAQPTYLENESEPHSGQFVWVYQITILNRSDESVRLRRRYIGNTIYFLFFGSTCNIKKTVYFVYLFAFSSFYCH